MRHTEFWARMDHHLGAAYARVWAERTTLATLRGRTPQEALDDGVAPKEVWRAVWEQLELPASER